MSKVKDYLLQRQQEQQELELWIGYMEYLRENDQDPTAIELDLMEQEYLDSKVKNYSCIIANHPIANNISYSNPKGA